MCNASGVSRGMSGKIMEHGTKIHKKHGKTMEKRWKRHGTHGPWPTNHKINFDILMGFHGIPVGFSMGLKILGSFTSIVTGRCPYCTEFTGS